MDIRNIKDNPIIPNGYDILDEIFNLGKEQLQEYRSIEDLPKYPLNINTKASQIILKDFIGRVGEELCEGIESLEEVLTMMDPKGWNMNRVNSVEYESILTSLQNANEEQADAMGFFITLLLYSNIEAKDIYGYYEVNRGIAPKAFNDLLAYGFSLHNPLDLGSLELSKGFDLINPSLFENFERSDYDDVVGYTPGFHKISQNILGIGHNLLWRVIYELNMTRNLLKNRPWKQTSVMTKELDYQEGLVKSFLLYLGYLVYNGFDQKSIYTLFFKKQRLNLWRIKTGY